MEPNHIVFGIHVMNRATNAAKVQELLTEYGCSIKTRLGLHHVDTKSCSPSGIVLLEMFGEDAPINELFDKLNALDGVEAQKMDFAH